MEGVWEHLTLPHRILLWKAAGAVDATKEVGHTCVQLNADSTVAAVWGNTLDPSCLGGAQSCANGTMYAYLTEADCTGAGHLWYPSTCGAVQAQTPPAACSAMIPFTFATYAQAVGGAGKQPWLGPPSSSLPQLSAHVPLPFTVRRGLLCRVGDRRRRCVGR